MPKFLLVDDNEELLEVQSAYLEAHEQEVFLARNGREALRLLQCEQVDILVTDVIMPEMEGLETIMAVRQTHPHLPIIVVSGGGRIGATDYLTMAKSMGAHSAMSKPIAPAALLAEARFLIEKFRKNGHPR